MCTDFPCLEGIPQPPSRSGLTDLDVRLMGQCASYGLTLRQEEHDTWTKMKENEHLKPAELN